MEGSAGAEPKRAWWARECSQRQEDRGRDALAVDEEDGRVVGRIPAARARMQGGRGVEPNRAQVARRRSQRIANKGRDVPTRDKKSEGIVGRILVAQWHGERGRRRCSEIERGGRAELASESITKPKMAPSLLIRMEAALAGYRRRRAAGSMGSGGVAKSRAACALSLPAPRKSSQICPHPC